MSQDFHGGVGQVAEGDINNFGGINIHLADKRETRGLVSAQRQELHELRAKCEELGDDPRDVWRQVHAQLGVRSLNEISAERFAEARSVMQRRLEHLQEDADKRRLIGKILRTTDEKDARKELNNFCDRRFGRTHLGNFARADLQVVLAFVQDFTVRPVVQPSVVPVQTQLSPATPGRLELREFLTVYRANAIGLFVFGLIVGKFWF
ncbi:hypothetical protein [Pseudomonas japonica]|uniref:Uncharacterized protein n=1 Tax=Pseudomonas japonica TaxID=256466 RepID=A0A239L018_9PSED|nr:hypothetical protein [Pseudomonas japonica]SNT23183.1 hypothetical protein SAMN05444352_13034 [Pseudomonas japonica]